MSNVPKFQVGDIVKYDGTSYLSAKKGATAVVVSLSQAPTYMTVLWDRNNELCMGQCDGEYYPYTFDIIGINKDKNILDVALQTKRINNLDYLEALNNLPERSILSKILRSVEKFSNPNSI